MLYIVSPEHGKWLRRVLCKKEKVAIAHPQDSFWSSNRQAFWTLLKHRSGYCYHTLHFGGLIVNRQYLPNVQLLSNISRFQSVRSAVQDLENHRSHFQQAFTGRTTAHKPQTEVTDARHASKRQRFTHRRLTRIRISPDRFANLRIQASIAAF